VTRTSIWSSLALDVGVALLLGVGFGTLQAHAGELAVSIPAPVLVLAGAGAVGLLLGLAGRFVPRGWSGLLRYLLAVLALLVWIAATGASYAAWSGLRPFEFLAGADDWFEAGQLGIGCLGIATALLAGRLCRDKMPPANPLPRKWALALNLTVAGLFGVLVGFGLARAGAGDPAFPIPEPVVSLGGAGIAGLLFSLAARHGLRWRTGLLRVVAVMLSLVVWVVVVEVTLALIVGSHPLAALAAGDDWIEAGQLAIGFQAAVVGGMFRRRAGLIETGQVEVGAARRRVRRTGGVRSSPSPRSWLGRRSRPAPGAPSVRVIGKAEDRCPYCLEVVEHNDPRGVVVCDVCHTPHHRDCWVEAGERCQVPHLVT
jgi:hypothetical protein